MGVTFAMKGMLEDREIPISSVLKEAGYTTGHFGKLHLGRETITIQTSLKRERILYIMAM